MAFGWEGELVRLVPLDSGRHLENAVRWLADPDVTRWTVVGDLPVTTAAYRTFDELADLLERYLGGEHFDAVIHLAAVSDYRLEAIEVDGKPLAPGSRGKIGSGHDLVLRLAPNPKLIDSLRTWSQNPDLRVVGFKLTDSGDLAEREAAVKTLLDRRVAQYVVLNDIGEISDGRHPAVIYANILPLVIWENMIPLTY